MRVQAVQLRPPTHTLCIEHKWFNYFDPIEILEIYEENIWAAINRMTYSGKYEHNIREFNKADTINIDATIEGDTVRILA